MLSRIFTNARNSLTNQTQRPQNRLSIEDSSEEFVRATRHERMQVPVYSSVSAAIFGLSRNNMDDFIQKDLISTSLY
ncbi:hypothetical protein K501DRAFT_288810 [Backusella circina FSU 941]|nr:hypothetical protein K501DRAFT_288810 [Backusella circina FSU 941]